MERTFGNREITDLYCEVYGYLAEYRDRHVEDLLDQAPAATFPASDPVAITAPRESA